MATEASAETGALVVVEAAADTGVVVVEVVVADTPQATTERTEIRADMATALHPTAKDMTAMLHTSKHLPDSRSSLGWLYFKDALLKKNVHVLLLTLVL